MNEQPLHGDVLITTEGGRHLLSVVPYPHRLTLSELTTAVQIAKKLAEANKTSIWRAADGTVTRLPRD